MSEPRRVPGAAGTLPPSVVLVRAHVSDRSGVLGEVAA